MDQYCKTGGNAALFYEAPPLAEVVLEDISQANRRIVYAEALKAGACWWHADGRPGRRGLPKERISDYVVLATRQPKPECVRELALAQLTWDGQFMHDGSGLKPTAIELPPITAKGAEVMKQQLEEAMHYPHPQPCIRVRPADDPFVSVFEPQHQDYWVRLNTAGRVKFSEALMMRYTGMKLDIAIDQKTHRIRIGEADHGKKLSGRGYVYARRLVPMVDFRGAPSVMIYLYENDDGYLYGNLALAGNSNGVDME
ncbi:hypothetical protein MF451_003769 [Salmonella enterica subsp. enterica serovar Saintpaul]|nr:hypothetical protein [Salmonella enterica subsp. enterica serovar Saintpaul]